MGLFASIAFHARDCHGAHCVADNGKAQACLAKRWKRRFGACLAAFAVCLSGNAAADTLRLAYFHSELSRDGPGLLLRDILSGDEQIQAWVRVVKGADPDVLVIGDIDFDLHGAALNALSERLEDYPFRFAERPNRGLDSGRDLDADGRLGGPGDAEGYADFAGQGGMAVLSRLPFDLGGAVSFSDFKWRDLPEHLALDDGRNPERLSTTVHWDLPLILPDERRLHLLSWHATAPVFDGPEDRNGRRNHDETRFWDLYTHGDLAHAPPTNFVIMGTANADPLDGESRPAAIRSLLASPLVQDPAPKSAGGLAAAQRDAGINAMQRGDPAADTVDWPDTADRPGNLRVDYVLPSRGLKIVASGVLWPDDADPLSTDVSTASRHRLIWLDIMLADRPAEKPAHLTARGPKQ